MLDGVCIARGLLFFWLACAAVADESVAHVTVDAGSRGTALHPIWAYFGYDEPNYTYAPNGVKLIGELAASSRTAVRFRTHHLLTTGSGEGALKFGSTNAYTEDAAERPVYDWTIVDRIIDTYLQAGAQPLLEIGFMPQALSVKPEPYTPRFLTPADFKKYYLGWSYPPKDYAKWSELIYQWARHAAEKYGRERAESWQWEVWNEPDISYWHGTAEDYNKLYDYTAAGLKRALPRAVIGGPASTSPRNARAAEFLRQFLQHCASGRNYATNGIGAPLDFVTFHAKGSPDISEGHVRMGPQAELRDAQQGFAIVRSFPKFKDLPVVLTEADPEGCAACSAKDNPANAYRNGTLYAAYTAVALKGLLDLAERAQVRLEGAVTWAFEFEDQPPFAGYRELSTNGLDKPVLNTFRMFGMNGEVRLPLISDRGQDLDVLLSNGVRTQALVDGIASRSTRSITVLIWHYRDEDMEGPEQQVRLRIRNLPAEAKRVWLQQFVIDSGHSNAYTAWQRLGSPQRLTPSNVAMLLKAGQLEEAGSSEWRSVTAGEIAINVRLPLQSLRAVRLEW